LHVFIGEPVIENAPVFKSPWEKNKLGEFTIFHQEFFVFWYFYNESTGFLDLSR